MEALGRHFLIDLKDCDPGILKSLERVREAMVEAAERAGATVVDVSFHQFSPFGISGMVIIAESHLSVHTWPEYGFAAVDIFTCGEQIKPAEAASFLIERFQCKSPTVSETKRGILAPFDRKLPHKVMPGSLKVVT